MRIVEVYKEIQEQEMNIVSTFFFFFFFFEEEEEELVFVFRVCRVGNLTGKFLG